MSTNTRYKLDELAREAGVSPRTVRYYVQRGLLASPVFRGKDSFYTEEHLVRLRAIRKLQDQFLPLDAIQSALDARTADEVARIAAGTAFIAMTASEGEVSSGAGPAPRARGTKSSPERPEPTRAPWERISLLDGVEIHVRADVPDDVRARVEAMIETARRA